MVAVVVLNHENVRVEKYGIIYWSTASNIVKAIVAARNSKYHL